MVNGPEQWQRHQEAGPVWTLGPEILCAHTTDSPKLMKHSQGCKFGVTSKATEYPSRSYYLPNYSHFPPQFLLLECVFEDWWRQNDEVAFPTQRAGLRPWQSRVFLTPHCAPTIQWVLLFWIVLRPPSSLMHLMWTFPPHTGQQPKGTQTQGGIVSRQLEVRGCLPALRQNP